MPQDRLPHGKTYFAIAFAAADTNQIPELLNHCFEWLDAIRRGSFDDTCVRHITHRLRHDSGAADLVRAVVMDPATPDSRAAGWCLSSRKQPDLKRTCSARLSVVSLLRPRPHSPRSFATTPLVPPTLSVPFSRVCPMRPGNCRGYDPASLATRESSNPGLNASSRNSIGPLLRLNETGGRERLRVICWDSASRRRGHARRRKAEQRVTDI